MSKLTTASVPAFEVASVKVNTSGAPPSGDAKGDRLTLYNMPLKVIVARAYQVTNDKVTGPAWLDTDSYDIVAKFAPDTARRDLWLMLQNLLVERFKLAIHHEQQFGRAMDVRFEDAGVAQGLRKASEREGTLRIVSIDGLDRSAFGRTHVRATGEIGPILLSRTEKIRQSVRVEFVCGGRADRGDEGQRILSAPPATVCPELEDHQPFQH